MHVLEKAAAILTLSIAEVFYDRAFRSGLLKPIALVGFVLLLGGPAHMMELALQNHHSLLLLIMIRPRIK